MSYAVVEAMVLGTIPIASKVGGVLEIVRSSSTKDFLFKPGDTYDFIEKLKALTTQPRETVVNFATKCREHVVKMSNEESLGRE